MVVARDEIGVGVSHTQSSVSETTECTYIIHMCEHAVSLYSILFGTFRHGTTRRDAPYFCMLIVEEAFIDTDSFTLN